MPKLPVARFAAVLFAAALSLSSCDETTSVEDRHGTVEVTNGGSATLARITLTYAGGSISTNNVGAGLKGTFTGIPQGAVSAAGFVQGSTTPVASASGTLTSSIALLRLSW